MKYQLASSQRLDSSVLVTCVLLFTAESCLLTISDIAISVVGLLYLGVTASFYLLAPLVPCTVNHWSQRTRRPAWAFLMLVLDSFTNNNKRQ